MKPKRAVNLKKNPILQEILTRDNRGSCGDKEKGNMPMKGHYQVTGRAVQERQLKQKVVRESIGGDK